MDGINLFAGARVTHAKEHTSMWVLVSFESIVSPLTI